ncbi:amidase signature domain-containing protein [Cercophora scortea]|uniref:Amidase signature domain-containing protein n=1 Tax=Cercophora scortea TaxID=314031 RepID=A0AAE0MDK3_9PEZI|nr:amidase signature domain-containing protein [Cercophora scortea]
MWAWARNHLSKVPRAWTRSRLARSPPVVTTETSEKITPVTSNPESGGHIFTLSEARYFVPCSGDSLNLTVPLTQDFGLVTVITLQPGIRHPKVTADWVRPIIEAYKNNDDVFSHDFLATVIFYGTDKRHVQFADDAREYLTQLGNKHVIFMPATSPTLWPGPYALVKGKLRNVWKLVDDSNGTCMVTLKPQLGNADTFASFDRIGSDDKFPMFCLSSRIQAQAAYDSPLAGLRIIVKDNIHLKGTKTSVGNRAFYNAYPPRQDTAECIQSLLSQGIVVAGKAKMNSFGNWEEPLEYIDYPAPWNPRADRYQSPGGSSSGCAAAVAAYECIDIAIGTDTWGSVTRPALWCGCFGLRPSIGAVSPVGVEPYCQLWDTAGILARDLQKLSQFANFWLDPKALEKHPKSPSSLIWPVDYWHIIDPAQVDIAWKFAEHIESALDVACSKAPNAQCYDAYHNCDDFRSRHWDQFGCAPYVSPPNRRMWAFAKDITKEQRDADFAKMDVFERWVNDTVLGGVNANALVIMPLESMTPRYRDESPTFKRPPQEGVNALALGPVMRSPVLAVPIAEIPYHSRITEMTEKLPFAVAIMGRPGSDLKLLESMHTVWKKAGLATTVKTGKAMF